MDPYNYRNINIDGADVSIGLASGSYSGVISHLPNGKYHDLHSYYSSTALKNIFSSSPYHFIKGQDQPRKPPTIDMILGSMVHCLVLTPDEFENEFLVMEKVDRRTKVGQQAHADAVNKCGDRQLIDEVTSGIAEAMASELLRDDNISNLLSGCSSEISYFWECPYSNLKFKARADAVSSSCLIELKTARSAKPADFERHAYNMNYDLSAYHYMEGARVHGQNIDTVYFITIENEWPYACQVFRADEDFLNSGHAKWLETINKLSEAKSSGVWPMYSPKNEILNLSVPRWAKTFSLGAEDGI